MEQVSLDQIKEMFGALGIDIPEEANFSETLNILKKNKKTFKILDKKEEAIKKADSELNKENMTEETKKVEETKPEETKKVEENKPEETKPEIPSVKMGEDPTKETKEEKINTKFLNTY